MAINETREIVIEATPAEILDVIADLESLTEWSEPHQSSGVLERNKDGQPSYTLTPDGDKTTVEFQISVDPVVRLPGFVLKRAVKGTIDTGTNGLRDRVLKVKKGTRVGGG
jgi:hypothetical protein